MTTTRARALQAVAGAVVLACGLVGCGHVDAAVPTPSATGPAATTTSTAGAVGVPAGYGPTGYRGRFRGEGMVLQDKEHGPQLCGNAAASFPPQCGGLDLVGWDWSAVPHHDANGVRWSDSVTVTGTLRGATLTLTDRVRTGGASTPAPEPDAGSPCPEPAGGWRPVDPATATQQALDAAVQRIRTRADYAAIWVDQSYLRPGAPPEEANDPSKLVLNAQFTGDLAAHVRSLRQVWGGALCVTRAQRTSRSLVTVQDELLRDVVGSSPAYWSTAVNERLNRVDAQATVAWWHVQQQLDARYGKGVVRLTGWLTPVDLPRAGG